MRDSRIKRKLSLYLVVLLLGFLLSSEFAIAQQRPEITKICMEHITFGKDASREAVITWRSSESNAEAYVRYWPDNFIEEVNISQAEYHDYRYARDLVYIYDARLTDLKPDTLYHYQIHCAGEESPRYNFYTAPEPGSNTGFTFAVLGDSRSNYGIFAQLMRIAYEDGARFAVFTGDMTDGGNQMEWDFWFAAAADTFPYLPFMPVHGNHEGMKQTYFDQFVLPDDEKSYSFDYGMTHWATILSVLSYVDVSREFLKEDLAASEARWKFFVTHNPFYASSPDFNPSEFPKDNFLDILEDYGVTMAFFGHVHTYERTYPLLADEVVEEGKGIIYQITGGAGAPFYREPDEPEYFSASYITTNHVIICEIAKDAMKATVKSVNGSIIDEYVVYPRTK